METPTNIGRGSPKDVFLQLGLFITLYISVVSLITLLMKVINYRFPDLLRDGDYGLFYDRSFYSSGSVRWALSALLILVPVHLILYWWQNKGLNLEPAKRESKFRKGLIYLTLFLTAGTVLITLIILVYHFLGGELTTRFLLKVISVLVVTGLVFFAYLRNVRVKLEAGPLSSRGYILITLVVVAASLTGGFLITGSPTSQRSLRLDAERVQDLQSLVYNLQSYWEAHQGKLPPDLQTLALDINYRTTASDPETGEPYGYTITGPNTFDLCATFTLATPAPPTLVKPRLGSEADSWEHLAGQTCFSRTLDPARLKPPTPRD